MKHEHSKHEATAPAGHQKHGNHYKHLVIMTLLSFVAMYILMYSMVDKINNVFSNVNQLYMAGLMAKTQRCLFVYCYHRDDWFLCLHPAASRCIRQAIS